MALIEQLTAELGADGTIVTPSADLSRPHRDSLATMPEGGALSDRSTYEMVGQWRGAVSAQHGIGIHKRPYLHHSRGTGQIATMRAVRRALDPHGIINPGKLF